MSNDTMGGLRGSPAAGRPQRPSKSRPRRLAAALAAALLGTALAAVPATAQPAQATAVAATVAGRPAAGVAAVSMAAGQVRRVNLNAYSNWSPPGVFTVLGNLLAVAPSADGFLTAYPCTAVNSPRPGTANVVFNKGIDASNLVMVRTDATGSFCVYSSVATTVHFDLLTDQNTATHPDFGPQMTAAPVRRLGTPGPVQVNAGTVVTIPTSSRNAPAFGTLTVVSPAGNGSVYLYPCGTARPAVPVLTTTTGRRESNATMTTVSATGNLCLSSTVSARFTWDQTPARFPANTMTMQPRRLTTVSVNAMTPVRLPRSAPIPGNSFDLTQAARKLGAWAFINTTVTTTGAGGTLGFGQESGRHCYSTGSMLYGPRSTTTRLIPVAVDDDTGTGQGFCVRPYPAASVKVAFDTVSTRTMMLAYFAPIRVL